jgi:CheY-like chemotaxis protein
VTDISGSTSAGTRHPLPAQLIHDLRTPLNQIIGYAELLMEQAEEAGLDSFAPHLGKVRAAGLKLLALMNENLISIRPPHMATGGEVPPREERRRPPDGESPGRPFPEWQLPEVAAPAAVWGSVLVVDDVEANRELLAERLVRQGYGVTTAENGREALETLFAGAFDLVLLDIMMPEMDGFEVLRLIKADDRLRHMPVIMISALSDMDGVARCIELGAEDYLPKPFNPTLLQARVRACLGRKRAKDREILLFEQLTENYHRLQALEEARQSGS